MSSYIYIYTHIVLLYTFATHVFIPSTHPSRWKSTIPWKETNTSLCLSENGVLETIKWQFNKKNDAVPMDLEVLSYFQAKPYQETKPSTHQIALFQPFFHRLICDKSFPINHPSPTVSSWMIYQLNTRSAGWLALSHLIFLKYIPSPSLWRLEFFATVHWERVSSTAMLRRELHQHPYLVMKMK